jgi:class 3 adenylate cyclase
MRVQRSFAFTDLSGFSALTEAEGDERAVGVISAFRTLLREICSRRGVRIAKWLGDGAMLVGVEPKPLLASMLELHRAADRSAGGERLSLCTGIASGEVILLEGDDYIGHPVNVAARLSEQATGGEILAQWSLVGDLPNWGAPLERADISLRGLEHPMAVAWLGMRPLDVPAVPDPVCHIPLTASTTEVVAVDGLGNEVWFCSDSCRDTWERRPPPPTDELGSLRTPLVEL